VSTKAPFRSIDEAFALARKRLPKVVYERMIGASIDQRDLLTKENQRIFDDVYWMPKACMAYDSRDLGTTVLGTPISLPVMLSSPGAARVFNPAGEPAVAAAAGKAGTVNIAAMGTGHTIEEVRESSTGPLWQQVYWSLGQDAVEEAMTRAAKAGYQAIVATVDMPVLAIPPGPPTSNRLLNRQNIKDYSFDAMMRPRWTKDFLLDSWRLRNIPDVEFRGIAPGGAPSRLTTGLDQPSQQMGPRWQDLAWLRGEWAGPLVVKGIATPSDAKRCLDIGADAIIVSNHGGMGLSSSAPSLRRLRGVVEAVAGECDVYFDSGVRRGSDIVKAVCMGAKAVLVGRAYMMGLAVAGEAGVRQVIEILRREIEITMGLLGCDSVEHLDESFLELPSSWS
jgi:isopentenyl diphosphate isomerase/L-lactate dehydrogenase-like FMN-dependent dehydrogenase